MNGRTLLFTILFMVSFPPSSISYEWLALKGPQGWEKINVHAIQATDEGVLIHGAPNGAGFGIMSPKGLFRARLSGNYLCVRVRLRTMSLWTSVSCKLFSHGELIGAREVPVYGGRTWKEYSFIFEADRETRAPIEAVALVFEGAENVELKEVTINGPSFSEFFNTQGIRPSDVNALEPFTIYGYSSALLFFCAAVLGGLVPAGYALLKKKNLPLAVMILSAALLGSYLVQELREDYEEAVIMHRLYQDNVAAAPAEKRFVFVNNLAEFSDFIRQNAGSGGDKPVRLFCHGYVYSYLEYLLYPIKIEEGRFELAEVNVFRGVTNARLEGTRLLHNGKVHTDQGRGLAFDPESFIYLTK